MDEPDGGAHLLLTHLRVIGVAVPFGAASSVVLRECMTPAQAESEEVNETLIELVKTVSAVDARMDAMSETVNTIKGEVSDLKNMAAQAQGFSNAAKAMWTLIGLMLGAGGTELVEKVLIAAP